MSNDPTYSEDPPATDVREDGSARLERDYADHSPEHGTRRKKDRGLWGTVVEYGFTVLVALVVAVLIKTFLVQPFFIPSASMRPTLIEQDKIMVSKLHPGVFDVERGDVVVFEDPANWVGSDPNAPMSTRQQAAKVLSYVGLAPDPSENHLVKRLIGKPGDHLVCEKENGPMKVNGVELSEPYISPESGACARTFDVTVPKGKLWVMGDNRSHSADSSAHNGDGKSGFVDQRLVTGKAFVIFMPFDRWGGLDDGKKAFATVPDAPQN